MKRIGVLVLAAALIITSAPQGAEAKKSVKLSDSKFKWKPELKKFLKCQELKRLSGKLQIRRYVLLLRKEEVC